MNQGGERLDTEEERRIERFARRRLVRAIEDRLAAVALGLLAAVGVFVLIHANRVAVFAALLAVGVTAWAIAVSISRR